MVEEGDSGEEETINRENSNSEALSVTTMLVRKQWATYMAGPVKDIPHFLASYFVGMCCVLCNLLQV